MNELAQLQAGWDNAARTDPYYWILTEPDHDENRWTREAFYARGEEEIDELFASLAQLGAMPHFGKALDFGCGVGRCTYALAKSFEHVFGVDISREMLALARERRPDNCTFYLNGSKYLPFEDDRFDFVYSNLVLQHMKPELSECYVRELQRVCKGILVFGLPDGGPGGDGFPAMYPVPEATVKSWVQGRVEVLHGVQDGGFLVRTYVVVK